MSVLWMVVLIIVCYFMIGVLWTFFCVRYGTKDIALSFYRNLYSGELDFVWVSLMIGIWPIMMLWTSFWLVTVCVSKGIKNILDARFGEDR